MIDIDAIKAGLDRGEFFLEYLPTLSLQDGRCVGAEALIRWRRAQGIVEPMDFIPVAENTPVSGLLTFWVLETVADELGDWLRGRPDTRLAINVPPEIIGRGGISYVAQRLGMMDLAPQIVLELTERGLPDAIGIQALKDNARNRRVRIALDDVSLDGAAAVALLARGSFDIIKLDRQLVAQIAVDAPRPAWLDDLATLAQLQRLEVIAEGVETAQQLATLREVGVQAAQGFYFSQPLAAAEFMAFHHRCAAGANGANAKPGDGAAALD